MKTLRKIVLITTPIAILLSIVNMYVNGVSLDRVTGFTVLIIIIADCIKVQNDNNNNNTQ